MTERARGMASLVTVAGSAARCSSRGSPEDLPRSVAPGGAHHAAARMRAGSAQVQTPDRCLVLRRAGHGARHEKLVKGKIRVMPVPTADSKLPLNIHGR